MKHTKLTEHDLSEMRRMAVNAVDTKYMYRDKTGDQEVSNLGNIILNLVTYMEQNTHTPHGKAQLEKQFYERAPYTFGATICEPAEHVDTKTEAQPQQPVPRHEEYDAHTAGVQSGAALTGYYE